MLFRSLRSLAARALELVEQHGSLRVVDWRDRIGIGRKRAIQLLEYFDRIGFTRRLANERRIRSDSALAIQLMGYQQEGAAVGASGALLAIDDQR